jgi:hypothetical protein
MLVDIPRNLGGGSARLRLNRNLLNDARDSGLVRPSAS